MSNDPKKSPNTPAQERPDPEVLPKAKRRKFTAKDKLTHIDAVASLKGTGEIGAYLRENGLYHSQLSDWRRAYDEGGIDALKPKTRGRKHLSQDEIERREQASKLAALEKKNAELERKLAQAEAIIEVQKKLAALVATLETSEDSRSDS